MYQVYVMVDGGVGFLELGLVVDCVFVYWCGEYCVDVGFYGWCGSVVGEVYVG